MIQPFLQYIPQLTAPYVIFDIGARDCEQSIEFYQQFPQAKIYSFECNPNTLPLCRKNIEPYQDRIQLIEGAVTDYDGTITFYPIDQEKTVTTWQDGNPGASSIYKANGTYEVEQYVQYAIDASCHRLDTVMTANGIERVDIIWMDLQGAELLALRSLGDRIHQVRYVYTEISHRPIYDGQVLFDELHRFMLENGFELLNRLTLRGWQEDAIYRRKEAV